MNATQVIEQFERMSDELSTPTVKAMGQCLDAWQTGQIATAELHELLTGILATANAHARGFADTWAAYILGFLGLVEESGPVGIAPSGVTAEGEARRLHKAVGTVLVALDQGEDIRMQLERLGLAEPVNAAQQQLLTTYNRHGVDGYTRGLDAGACELCNWLYKDGYVYPTSKSFHRHAGCRCAPIPTKG